MPGTATYKRCLSAARLPGSALEVRATIVARHMAASPRATIPSQDRFISVILHTGQYTGETPLSLGITASLDLTGGDQGSPGSSAVARGRRPRNRMILYNAATSHLVWQKGGPALVSCFCGWS